MPVDRGFSVEDKLNIARLIDEGVGKRAIGTMYGASQTTAGKWVYVYRAFGLDGLLNMGSTKREYDLETKLAAVRAHVDDGLSKQEVMVEFGVLSMSALQRWCKAYREGGAEALEPKPKGRPKGAANKPKEPEGELERLRAENERLRCALEVEKRLNALASRRQRRGERNPR